MDKLDPRDINSGPLKFHRGIEQELLEYVKTYATKGDPESVIKTVDKFCWEHHWMMHVGGLKGGILDNVVHDRKPRTILELGTYCGYSAIRMARLLPDGGVIHTVDINPQTMVIAKQMVEWAGLSEKVIFHRGFINSILPELTKKVDKFDLVFFDHSKRDYYPDLLKLENLNLVGTGSILVADNVVIFQIDDYMNYVYDADKFLTILHESNLEYCHETKKDGVVVSVYLPKELLPDIDKQESTE